MPETTRMKDKPCCKVGRGIQKYDCTYLDEDIEREYQKDSSIGVRQLESFINQRFISAAVEERDPNAIIDSKLATIVLRGEADDRRIERQMRANLTQLGLEPEELKKDLVSHRTVHKHLRKCLELDTSKQTQRTTARTAKRTISKSLKNTEEITRSALHRLYNNDELDSTTTPPPDEVEVSVRISVRNPTTGEQLSYTEFIDYGGFNGETTNRE